MSSNSDIFSSIIKAKIDKYATGNTISEEGKVISVSDGIVIALGLKNVMLNELVLFSNGSMGMALNLETDYVGIVMLDKYDDIKENSIVKRTKTVVSIGVGDGLIGRIVDPLGRPIDGKGQITFDFTNVEVDLICNLSGHVHHEIYRPKNDTSKYLAYAYDWFGNNKSCTFTVIDKTNKKLVFFKFDSNSVYDRLELDY